LVSASPREAQRHPIHVARVLKPARGPWAARVVGLHRRLLRLQAAMESFWATLKRELAWIHRTRRWASRTELRAALFDYIEIFYNRTATKTA
jgi:transposase InsO family protein